MNRLEGRVAMITGAGGGIGLETARLFAAEGASIVALDLSAQSLEAVSAAVGSSLPASRLHVGTCDVSDEASVAKAVQDASARLGPIDVLFNCAGGSSAADSPITEVNMGIWQRTLSVDLLGTMLCCRHVIPHMITAGRGSIVNVSSWGALRGNFQRHIYMAAKGGVISFTRGLAGEYAKKNIRANAVAPGSIRTPRTMQRHDAKDESDPKVQTRKRLQAEYPFSSGDPIDIANIALFLASDESRMITGQTLAADGGRSAY